jgi:hypothetical protein
MPTRSGSMTDILEARMFKPAPGGYIFQAQPPTQFHRTQAYLVNESRKAEILAILRAGRWLGMRIVAVAALALAVAAGVLVDALGAPLLAGIFLGVCVFLFAAIAGYMLVLHFQQRQLQPLLAGLQRSDERLFPEPDLARLLYGRPSYRDVAIQCTVLAFLLGTRIEQQHPPFTDVWSTVFLAFLALNLFWALRPTPADAQGTDAR